MLNSLILSALVGCHLITEDQKSYSKLCISGGVESWKTWQRTDLFSFLLVILGRGAALGLNFVRSESNVCFLMTVSVPWKVRCVATDEINKPSLLLILTKSRL